MIAKESHTQRKELTWLVGQRKSKAGWSHFTDHLPALIELKRHERTYLREGLKTVILVRSQQGNHRITLSLQVSEKRGRHAFTIHHYASGDSRACAFFLACKNVGKSHRQVLIPTIGRNLQRMPLFIVQQNQGTTSKDLPCATDESAWNELLCVHGFPMAINIDTGRIACRCLRVGACLPELGCPIPKGMGEGLCSSCMGQLGKKTLDVSIAVGTLSPGEHTQSIPTVSTQIPGATQSDGTKEEQREQEH